MVSKNSKEVIYMHNYIILKSPDPYIFRRHIKGSAMPDHTVANCDKLVYSGRVNVTEQAGSVTLPYIIQGVQSLG